MFVGHNAKIFVEGWDW